MDMQASDASLDLSSSSRVTGKLDTGDITMNLSGSSHADLNGSGHNLALKGSGSSQVTMPDIALNDAYVALSGSSEGSLYVNGRLDVELNSSSTLTIKGNPVLGSSQINGSSNLIHK
jgi:hypothetical protein